MKKILLLIAFILPLTTMAQPISSYDEIVGTYVYDKADVLSKNEELKLNNLIASFFDTVQIAVITANSLEGYEPYEYATYLGSHLGVGNKHYSNGILILVSPGERKYFTAVGTDLEGYLTDIASGRLQRELLVPALKQGDWYNGVDRLTSGIIAYLKKYSSEIKAEELSKKADFENKVANNISATNNDRYVPSEITKTTDKESGVNFVTIIILFIVGILIILGFIYYNKYKKEEARKKAINDAYYKVVDKVHILLSLMEDAKKLGLDINKNVKEYLETIDLACEEEVDKIYETNRFYNTFAKSGVYYTDIETARILINNYNEANRIINKKDSFKRDYNTYLDKIGKTYFHKVEQSKIDTLKDNFKNYSSSMALLESDFIAKNHDNLKQSVSISRSYISKIENIFSIISGVLKKDKMLFLSVIAFKEKTDEQLKKHLSYCYREGVSKSTSDKVSDTCHTIIGMLRNYEELSLQEKYKIYLEVNKILEKSDLKKAKREWDDYQDSLNDDNNSGSGIATGILIGSMMGGSSGGFGGGFGGGSSSGGGFGGGGFSGGGSGGSF